MAIIESDSISLLQIHTRGSLKLDAVGALLTAEYNGRQPSQSYADGQIPRHIKALEIDMKADTDFGIGVEFNLRAWRMTGDAGQRSSRTIVFVHTSPKIEAAIGTTAKTSFHAEQGYSGLSTYQSGFGAIPCPKDVGLAVARGFASKAFAEVFVKS